MPLLYSMEIKEVRVASDCSHKVENFKVTKFLILWQNGDNYLGLLIEYTRAISEY